MPPFLALTSGLLEGHLDGTNTLDELMLSLPAWFFASRPWTFCSMSFGLPFGCFLFGVCILELLQTWDLLEPLGLLALLMGFITEQLIFLLKWWRVLPHRSLSLLDKDIMDLLNTTQETFMSDPVDTWFEREPIPPCRCCGLIGAHFDRFSNSDETTPAMEPEDFVMANATS